MKWHVAPVPAALVLLLDLVVGPATPLAVAYAVEPDQDRTELRTVPDAPHTPSPLSYQRRQDDLHRRLFETFAAYSNAKDQATRDSLKAVQAEISAELKRLKADRAPNEPRAPREPEGGLFGEFEREFSRTEGPDWAEIERLIEEGVGSFGELAEHVSVWIEQTRLEIDEDQVGLETPGGKFRVNVSPEVREGIRGIAEELGRALSDSSGSPELDRELRALRKYLPEGASEGLFGFVKSGRSRDRRVIAKTVFKVADDFEVAEDEVVTGDVYILGGDCYISGEVQGTAICIFGDIYLEDRGVVGNDAISIGGEVSLDGESSVHGRRFDISQVAPGLGAGWGSGSVGAVVYGIRVLMLVLLLFLATSLVPRRLQLMTDHATLSPLRNILFGSFWLSVAVGAFVVLAVGLAITVIGIPVVFVLAVAFLAALLGAYFVACQLLGERLLASMGGDRERSMWISGLLGLVILEIPAVLAMTLYPAVGSSSALLPVLDYIVKFLAISFGFASVVATRFGSREADPVGAPLDADVPPPALPAG